MTPRRAPGQGAARPATPMVSPDSPGLPAARHRGLRLASVLVCGAAAALLARAGGLSSEAVATAGTAGATAAAWLTGAVPLPVASLLPALLLPALGALPAAEVAPRYFPEILLLFLGGFILALALERHGLHRRFALRAVGLLGTRPRRVVLGFMAVAMGLSMFVSNTSTALLMLPVAVAVLDACRPEEARRLSAPLLLGIAWACSIGGVATPIGTAPNAVLLGQLETTWPEAPLPAFGTWVIGTFPFCLSFLLVAWAILCRVGGGLPHHSFEGLEILQEERRAAGRRSRDQTRVLAVFAAVALAWLSRQGVDFGGFRLPGWAELLPARVQGTLADSTVALAGVLLLFVLPGEGTRGGALLDWEDCVRIPWGILLLLGGGFALAHAIQVTGLAEALGGTMEGAVATLPPWGLVFLLSLFVTFLTEITSNTATISVLLPLFFSAARAAGVHPLLLGLPATLAVSCAFMLPVATPPNAILFSSGRISIATMARTGFVLNLATAVLVTAFTFLWVAPRWGLELRELPAWAR